MMSGELDDIKVKSIELLLRRCLSKEQKWIAKLASIFQSHGVIPKDFQKDFNEEEENDPCGVEVIHKLCLKIGEARNMTPYLSQACASEEFPGDAKIGRLINKIIGSPPTTTECFLWLLESWDELMIKQTEISRVINARWPELWQRSESGLDTKTYEKLVLLLLRMSELTPESSKEFVEILKKILENGADGDERRHQESQHSVTDSDDDDAWFEEAWDFLKESYDSLQGKVKSLWPEESKLVDKKKWPLSLQVKFGKEDEKFKLKMFIQYAKVEELEILMNKNCKLLKDNKDDIVPLVKKIWPNESELMTRWPQKLFRRCSQGNEPDKIVQFATDLKRFIRVKLEGKPQVAKDGVPGIPSPGKSLSKPADSKHALQVKQPASEKNDTAVPVNYPAETTARNATKSTMDAGKSSNDTSTPENDEFEILSESQTLIAWLEEAAPRLKKIKDKVYTTVNPLFPNEKGVANDPDFPSLLIEKLSQEKDLLDLVRKIKKIKSRFQEITSQETAQLIQSEQRTTTFGSSSVDSDLNSNVHVVEFRVISLPSPSEQTQIHIGDRSKKMQLTDSSQHLWHREAIKPGEIVQYRFSSEFGADKNSPHEYKATSTTDTSKTAVVYVVVCWNDPKTFVQLDNYLPDARKLHDLDEKRVIQDVMGFMTKLPPEKIQEKHLLKVMTEWATNVLNKQNGSDLNVLIGCAIVTSHKESGVCTTNDHAFLDRIFQLLCTEKANEQLFEKVISHFPKGNGGNSDFKNLTDSLTMLLCGTGNISFILALPFYHLLSNGGRDNVDVGAKATLEKRCYLPGRHLTRWNDKAKDSSEIQGNLLKLEPEIMRLSETYPWILYSYLFFLTGKGLVRFFKEKQSCLLSLRIEFLLDKFPDAWSSISNEAELEKILKMLQNAFCRNKRFLVDEQDAIYGTFGCIQSLLNTIKQFSVSGRPKIPAWTKNPVTLFCASISHQVIGIHSKMKEDFETQRQAKVRSQFDGIISFINESVALTQDVASTDQVKFWNKLLKIQWHDNSIRAEMEAIMKKLVEEKSAAGPDKKYIGFYIDHVQEEDLDQTLKSIYEEAAVKCFPGYLQRKKGKNVNVFLSNKPDFLGKQKKRMKFFGKYLGEQLKTQNGVSFLLKWTHAVEVVESLYHSSDLRKVQPEVAKQLNERVDSLLSLIKSTCDRTIPFAQFIELEKNRERCIAILNLDNVGKSTNSKPSKRYHCRRFKEEISVTKSFEDEIENGQKVVKEYESTKTQVEDLIKECKVFSGSLHVDCGQLAYLTKVDINCRNIGGIQDIFKELNGDEEVMGVLKRNEILKGNTFYRRRCCFLSGEIRKGGPESGVSKSMIFWDQAILKIFHPAQCEVQIIAMEIYQGTLPIRKIPDLFEPKASDDVTTKYVTQQLQQFYKLLDIQLEAMEMETRTNQMLGYHDLKTAMEATKLLLQIKKVLNLKGDFNSLDDFDENWLEKDLNHLPKLRDDIREFKAEHVKILEAFLEQEKFIRWLMEETKDIKDIVTLGELAKLNARGGKEMDKISALRSAVAGFSPLIYDLRGKKPKETGTQTLKECCFQVFTNCDGDTKLLQKWEIAGSHVGRIIETVKIYGESGKLSMETVQKINDRGIYVISRKAGKTLSLENYVHLELPDENKKKHSGLRDLHSQIILISGNYEKDEARQVDIFVELLTAVESLAQVCMDLSEAGCLLFEDLEITIGKRRDADADTAKKLEFTITISLNKKAKNLTGIGNFETIHEIIRNLKELLDRWSGYMSGAFEQHYYLNEYTNDQITFLCKELGKTGITNLSDQATMLLAKIRPTTISLGELNFMINEATKLPAGGQNYVGKREDLRVEETKEEAMIRAVRHLHFERDIDENVAKAAVAAAGIDLEKSLIWTYIHGENDEEVEKFQKQFEDETVARHQGRNIQANFEVLHSRVNKNLDDIIMSLQQSQTSDLATSLVTLYEVFVRETGSLTMNGLLNLGHFGKFLTMLGESSTEGSRPQRTLCWKHQRGTPNVIICEKDDIPKVTLNLYAAESDNPLPTTSEVLLCQETTTMDQVNRFFRRALYKCTSNGSPIFCLSAAHKLRHGISESAGNLFHKLIKGEINREYQLVIISSDRGHFLSTCFDKEPQPPPANFIKSDGLRGYLEEKLKGNISTDIDHSIVKIVYSHRSGVGKSLHIERLKQKARNSSMGVIFHYITIRCMEKLMKPDIFTDVVLKNDEVLNEDCHFMHLDMTPAIQDGLLHFAFNLLILGSIEDSQGRIWRRNPNHFYAMEMTLFEQENKISGISSTIKFLQVLPNVLCLSPEEILRQSREGIAMDEQALHSDNFQRSSQYLKRIESEESVAKFTYNSAESLDQNECIRILLKYCPIKDPSWSQLRYFATFLNMQLKKCERCYSCKQQAREIHDIKGFVIHFLIRMAQDLSSSSVEMEDMGAVDDRTDGRNQSHKTGHVERYREQPFIFFNDDGASMTFINMNTKDQLDVSGENYLARSDFSDKFQELPDLLMRKGVAIDERFDDLTRKEKLQVLYRVMGIPVKERKVSGKWDDCLKVIDDESGNIRVFRRDKWWKFEMDTARLVSLEHLPILRHCKKYGLVHGNKFEELEKMLQQIAQTMKKFPWLHEKYHLQIEPTVISDPDHTYELSTDNVLKILAIHMRFLCNIPVIIKGETGCGKTRMIKFMADLRKENKNEQNLLTLRVHGGINVEDIRTYMQRARTFAKKRGEKSTVFLFFDEANTTEAIYAIKEVICDQSSSKEENDGFWIVAACNPYKKLSPEAIDKLAKAGLGYRVRSEKGEQASDPMHTLVYRVLPIPPSMQPFVWDFGRPGDAEERLYIKQMVIKMGQDLKLLHDLQLLIMDIFSHTHTFMRKQDEECKYVSLRDVERCITAYKWFHNNASWLSVEIEKISGIEFPVHLHIVLQVLGLCYHASLENRKKFREEIAEFFRRRVPEQEEFTDIHFLKELHACQYFIVSHMDIGKNIAINEALLENVYMIAICAEMKIPLFLVGKPGSSKSLAKTIVAESLLGDSSKKLVCKQFKEIGMTSFQCSALTHAMGIKKVFKQCALYQSKENPDKYVSVVALDEIGLAEDSPHMPLKILHALLESGSVIDDDLANKNNPSKRVGFLGISNWSLDPAKMNRGIFVTRGAPDERELTKTTDGIFSDCDSDIKVEIQPIITSLIYAYQSVIESSKSEFFGLRDLYSTMKMIKASVLKRDGRRPILTLNEVMKAVITNFNGEKKSHVDTFRKALIETKQFYNEFFEKPSIDKILERNLSSRDRHLLLLTKKHTSLDLLTYALREESHKVRIVYGSAFPGDNNDTASCRNVNRIKVCMENDCIAIILNLRKIHESLYDALNQHYVTLGDNKYVDLGLGSSEDRIKCRVHDKFRIIFLEEEDVVYKEYPVPLINRLEKHLFDSEMFFTTSGQQQVVKTLKRWAEMFSSIGKMSHFTERDAFVGYHEQFSAAVILILMRESERNCNGSAATETISKDSQKYSLVQCATVDSIVRLQRSKLVSEVQELRKVYFQDQKHENLSQFLYTRVNAANEELKLFDVTTFSNILMENDIRELEAFLSCDSKKCGIVLLSLLSYDTLKQFSETLDSFFKNEDKKILLIQCGAAQEWMDRIACARHCLLGKLTEYNDARQATGVRRNKAAICFLLCTSRHCSAGSVEKPLILQPTTNNEIVYIDELQPVNRIGPISNYLNCSLGEIFRTSLNIPNEADSCRASESLDMILLLKSCLCEALSPLKSSGTRTERRIKILSSTMDKQEFMNVLCKKIVLLFEQRDMEMKNQTQEWILDEACDRAKLLEAGSFQRVIWLYLKKKLGAFLCYITSIIDANSNLDLAAADGLYLFDWYNQLWISMFEKVAFHWSAIESDKRFEVATVETGGLYKFRFPFSFLLHEELTRRWKGAAGREKDFILSLREWELMSPVEKFYLAKGKEVLNILFNDLTWLAYSPGSSRIESELNAVINIVKEWSMKHVEKSEKPDTWIFEFSNAIAKFMRLRMNFHCFSEAFKKWPDLISSSENWVENSDCENDILQSAFIDLVGLLTKRITGLGKAEQCSKWIDDFHCATKVFSSVWEETAKKCPTWSPISFIHLLLTQLAPADSSSMEVQGDYMGVVAKEAVTVGSLFVYKPSDIGNENSLRVVCQVLANCYKQIKLKILINWNDVKCRICAKRMVEPRKLQCNHYICRACLQSSKTCPTCSKRFVGNEDDIDKTPTLSDKDMRDLHNFKLKCTSLIVNYITSFVGDSKALDLVLKELFLPCVHSSTGEIKLNLSSIDHNLMMKTCVLKHLWKFYQDETTTFVNKNIATDSSGAMHDAMLAMILHFQSQYVNERVESLILSAKEIAKSNKMNVEVLKHVAKLRRGLWETATKLYEETQKTGKANDDTILIAKRLFECDETDEIQKYFIKICCKRFGIKWLVTTKNSLFQSGLIPANLVASLKFIDLWKMMDREHSLQKSKPGEREDVARKLLTYHDIKELIPVFASISMAMEDQQSEELLRRELKKLEEHSASSPLNDVQKVMQIFASAHVQRNPADKSLMQLLVVSALAIRKQPYLMNEFMHLLKNPATADHLFLPSMPVSMYFSVPKDYRTRHNNQFGDMVTNMFACPNGHMYMIDNCTRPLQQRARCPACGEIIGGEKKVLDPGNVPLEITEVLQAGYILDDPESSGLMDNPDDRISQHGVIVTRFILHSCLLLGVYNNKEVISKVSKAKVPNHDDFVAYLLNELRQHIENLADCLQKSTDDAQIILYKILSYIITTKVPSGPLDGNLGDWSSVDSRRLWEQQFRNVFLLPIFGNLDRVLEDDRDMVAVSGEFGRLGRDLPTPLFHEAIDEKCPPAFLWHNLKRPSINGLLQHIQDTPNSNTGGFLKVILKRTHLELTRFLVPVLQLQSAMIKRYQYTIEPSVAKKKTFSQYLLDEDSNSSVREMIDIYFDAWEKAQERRWLGDTCKKLTMSSPISFALPRRPPPGNLRRHPDPAKLLLQALATIQNECLQRCAELDPELRPEEVSFADLRESHMCRFSIEEDLLHLIEIHTKYDIHYDDLKGASHQITYDVQALESLVLQKYVRHKKLIKIETMPYMRYSQDIGLSEDWDALDKLIKQEPLPADIEKTVDSRISNNEADLYEGVRTLSHAISFLGKTSSRPDKSLKDYMIGTLLLDQKRLEVIPPSVQIKQTLALYRHLTWHKAVKFVRQGIDPYKDVLTQGKEVIPADVKKHTVRAFKDTGTIKLQKRINEVLITKLDLDPSWSLVEEIFPDVPYLDEDSDDNAWFKSLPTKLRFAHIVELFKLTVTFMDEKKSTFSP